VPILPVITRSKHKPFTNARGKPAYAFLPTPLILSAYSIVGHRKASFQEEFRALLRNNTTSPSTSDMCGTEDERWLDATLAGLRAPPVQLPRVEPPPLCPTAVQPWAE
jgi:hypothetical protein